MNPDSKTPDQEALTRMGMLVRKAFIAKKAALSPDRRYEPQARSDVKKVWNRAGEICAQFAVDPQLYVDTVFSSLKGTPSSKFGVFQNMMAGQYAANCMLRHFGLPDAAGKDGSVAQDILDKVGAARTGDAGVKLSDAIDPHVPLVQPGQEPPTGVHVQLTSGSLDDDYVKFWSALRETNSLMLKIGKTLNPKLHTRLFTLHTGTVPLNAKAILGYELPEVVRTIWPVYADSLVTNLAEWRILKARENDHPGIRRFVAWVRLTRRSLYVTT